MLCEQAARLGHPAPRVARRWTSPCIRPCSHAGTLTLDGRYTPRNIRASTTPPRRLPNAWAVRWRHRLARDSTGSRPRAASDIPRCERSRNKSPRERRELKLYARRCVRATTAPESGMSWPWRLAHPSGSSRVARLSRMGRLSLRPWVYCHKMRDPNQIGRNGSGLAAAGQAARDHCSGDPRRGR